MREEVPLTGTRAGATVETFESFFERVLPRALGVATGLLGDRTAAEDAATEALARAFVAWDRLTNLPYRDAWVLRVTLNVAYDELRRVGRQLRVIEHRSAEGDALETVELRETLEPALRTLSRRQREVVVLHYMAGLTVREVAEVLGCSENSVKTHARRGVVRLRQQFNMSDWEQNGE